MESTCLWECTSEKDYGEIKDFAKGGAGLYDFEKLQVKNRRNCEGCCD